MMEERLAVFVDPAFKDRQQIVFRTIEQLLEIAGWGCTRIDDPNSAHVCYSPDLQVNRPIPCAGAEGWSTLSIAVPSEVQDLIVPSSAVLKPRRAEVTFDWVMSAYFFLAGVPERDDRIIQYDGIPNKEIAKWGLLDQPTVQVIAEMLRHALCLSPSVPPPRPKWPEDKEWCLAMTHDCDRIYRFRPAGFLKDTSRFLRERNLAAASMSLLKVVYAATAKALRQDDPYMASWRSWCELEQELGLPSAYYVGTWGRYQRNASPKDLPYSCEDPGLRRMVMDLNAQGCEVGLHSSVRAWEFGRFDEELARFRTQFGFGPDGFRGHCWSLDPDDPIASLAQAHRSAGFKYDSTLGMNVTHGFRRGIAYPYRPFDVSSGSYAGLVELPPIMMDQALFLDGATTEQRLEAFRRRRDDVKAHGGCLVMDWHTDSLSNGYMDDLAAHLLPELQTIVEDESCWLASPRRIVQWCEHGRWQEQRAPGLETCNDRPVRALPN